MSKILVTGANGFIGQYIVNKLVEDKLYEVIATGKTISHSASADSRSYQYHIMDITDRRQVEKLFAVHQPEIVIHAAALGQPDYCEQNEEKCFNVNVLGTKNIAESCKKIDSFLVFLSSDFVFDGEKGPYSEDDPINPINRYGYSKAEGERSIHQAGTDHAVVRLCAVYGIPFNGTARNIITWVKENLESNNPIKAVCDQVRTPTYIYDATEAIITLAGKKLEGIFHISGDETYTPYDMAVITAGQLGLNEELVQKVDSASLNQPAKRPLRTGFIIDKAKKSFDFSPHTFAEALTKLFQGG